MHVTLGNLQDAERELALRCERQQAMLSVGAIEVAESMCKWGTVKRPLGQLEVALLFF